MPSINQDQNESNYRKNENPILGCVLIAIIVYIILALASLPSFSSPF